MSTESILPNCFDRRGGRHSKIKPDILLGIRIGKVVE